MTTRPKSNLEATFAQFWTLLATDLPKPTREHRFHAVRRFRFDFAWLPQKVAVELEGGTFSGGRHTRGIGFETDCIKYNLATADGWRVFRFTTQMLERDPAACIGMIRDALKPCANVVGELGGRLVDDHRYFVGGQWEDEAPEM